MQNNPRLKFYCIAFLVAFSALAAVLAYNVTYLDLTKEDIYYNWLEGYRLARGENPYSRINSSDMRVNDKYATYFPLFYELSYLANFAGLKDFQTWIEFWRLVFLLCNLGVAVLIFIPFYRKELYFFALFASAFWLFNRWTLHAMAEVRVDFLATFFLVLSLSLIPKRRNAAFLLFGLSLGIKQIAIFTLPLYLIWAWQFAKQKPLYETLKAGLLIAAVPVISTVPFALWDLGGLIKSILFSATRLPNSFANVFSLDVYMGLVGIVAKLPLLILLLMVFYFVWQKKLAMYMAAFLSLTIFTGFNSVFFPQYMVWGMSLLPFVILEHINKPADVVNS